MGSAGPIDHLVQLATKIGAFCGRAIYEVVAQPLQMDIDRPETGDADNVMVYF